MKNNSFLLTIFNFLASIYVTYSQNVRDPFYGSEVYTGNFNPTNLSLKQNPENYNVNPTFSEIINQNSKGIFTDSSQRTSSNVYYNGTRAISSSVKNSNVDRRDYVNPNHRLTSTSHRTEFGQRNEPEGSYFPQTLPTSTVRTPNNGQNSGGGRRDYVNPNHRVTSTSHRTEFGQRNEPEGSYFPQSLSTSTVRTPNNGQNSGGGRRDYVNPNHRVTPKSHRTEFVQINESEGSYFPQSLPTSTVRTPNNGQNSGGGRRDYVNPNYPLQPTLNKNTRFGNRDNLASSRSPNTPTQNRSQFEINQQKNTATSTQKINELATDDELTTLSETLFSEDINNQNKNIIVNYQGRTRSSETTDEAPDPLLQVQDTVFQLATISAIRMLYNNYESDTSVNEYVTAMERQEEDAFINAILGTRVMRQSMLFLQNKGIVTPDPRTHKDLLKAIWFTLYSRGNGRIGSSGFEHVFVNEIKNGTITGFHNWIYYYEQERQGRLNYKGYIKKLDLGNKGAILKYRFNYNGIEKPVNSMFIGTSPELEMALYTVCFQVRPDKNCPLSVNGNKFNMKTFTFRYRGKNLIGSAFPEI